MEKYIRSSIVLLLGVIVLLPFWVGCEQKDDQSSSEAKLIGVEPSHQLSQQRYLDPKDFFEVIPPKGWSIQEYPEDPRGKVAFKASEDVSLRILTSSVDFTSFEQLLSWCKTDGREKMGNFGATNITIEKISFGGKPAVRRIYQAHGRKFLNIDFLIGEVDHNLQYCAPPSKYSDYLPVTMKSMETYEPILRHLSDEEAKKHYVAKSIRLAQLMIENRNYDLALDFVKEGLEESPKDPALLKLKKQIEDRSKKR